MTLLNKIGLMIAGLAVLLMCVIGTVDVVSGYLFRSPVPAAYEVTELLMAIAVFLAISSLQERRMNIYIETLHERMGARPQMLVTALSLLIGLFIFGLIAWQSWLLAIESFEIWEYTQGAYRVPVYPTKILFACGATLIVAQYIKDTYELFTGRSKPVDRSVMH